MVKKKKISTRLNKQKPLTVSQKKHVSSKKLLFFALKFALIFAVLNILIELADLSSLTNFITSICANYLGLSLYQNAIVLNQELFIVTNLCTGLVDPSNLA